MDVTVYILILCAMGFEVAHHLLLLQPGPEKGLRLFLSLLCIAMIYLCVFTVIWVVFLK